MYHLIFTVKIKIIYENLFNRKNLVNLVISRALINSGINVVLYKNNFEAKHRINKSRTVGLSQNSIDFLEEQGINIKKIGHKINKINLQKNGEKKIS